MIGAVSLAQYSCTLSVRVHSLCSAYLQSLRGVKATEVLNALLCNLVWLKDVSLAC